MSDLYLKSINRRWLKEVSKTDDEVIIVSPYLTDPTANSVLDKAPESGTRIYTLFDLRNFLLRASSFKAVKRMFDNDMEVYHIDKLHAKMIIIPDRFASIGSQNLTTNGTRGREASVVFTDPDKVHQIAKEFEAWESDAIQITQEMMDLAEEYLSYFENNESFSLDKVLNEVNKASEAFDIRCTILNLGINENLEQEDEFETEVETIRDNLHKLATYDESEEEYRVNPDVAALFIQKSI